MSVADWLRGVRVVLSDCLKECDGDYSPDRREEHRKKKMKGEKETTISERSQGYEGMAEIRSERTVGIKTGGDSQLK